MAATPLTIPTEDVSCQQTVSASRHAQRPRTGLPRRMLEVQVVVVLFCGPYLATLLDADNRLANLWTLSDSLLVLGTMAALGLALGLAWGLLDRVCQPGFRGWTDHLLVPLLAMGLLAIAKFQLPHPFPWLLRGDGVIVMTVFAVLFAGCGLSIAGGGWLARRAGQVCLVLSPLLIILPAQLAWGPTYAVARDPLPPLADLATPADGTPVHVFLFDCWSHERTFHDGAVVREMPALGALTRRATVFHNAYAPGDHTTTSIPRLLFPSHVRHEPVERDGVFGFATADRFLPARDETSVFHTVARQGYRTAMVGFSLSYAGWLGGQVDTCRSYRWPAYITDPDAPLVTRAGDHAVQALAYAADPWTLQLQRWLGHRDRHFVHLYERVNADMLSCVENGGNRFLGVYHLPYPHPPYLVNRDGSYRVGEPSAHDASDPVGYTHALGYMDRVLHDVVQALEGRGQLDDALLILTADHSWWSDPERRAGRMAAPPTRVPFIVKWPGQRVAEDVWQTVETVQLGQFISMAVEQRSAFGSAVEAFAAMSGQAPAVAAGVPEVAAERVE